MTFADVVLMVLKYYTSCLTHWHQKDKVTALRGVISCLVAGTKQDDAGFHSASNSKTGGLQILREEEGAVKLS